ncbi:hypothetical protein EVAR_67082_1 [Eumeta japonica]|uniref:Uncharacterized protein n=1 Tax=Eumeta variegata TaxID=151549 RepID=A0A4C1SU44_EUMVA|nr:hypothetical protein EVAR_67082_1 [Eumeta japonica]
MQITVLLKKISRVADLTLNCIQLIRGRCHSHNLPTLPLPSMSAAKPAATNPTNSQLRYKDHLERISRTLYCIRDTLLVLSTNRLVVFKSMLRVLVVTKIPRDRNQGLRGAAASQGRELQFGNRPEQSSLDFRHRAII